MSTPSEYPRERSRRIMLILGSARPGRVALPITLWVNDVLSDAPDVTVDFVDLMEEALPFMNEPHPRQGYVHAHSRAWSERVIAADAVIFVAPAYGDGFSPVVRNAIDYLSSEWNGKRTGLVTYGRQAKRLTRRLRRSLHARGMDVVHPLLAIEDADARVHGFDFSEDQQSSRACERMISELRPARGAAPSRLAVEGVA
ncbi:NADPH-dependent FMN reductase [Microbacterium sp. MPKO10]|uniref:NADPH-dependent FMN reductase n=1 Tax=Microbacterium sp. MPKO10 TaxID=2989818 RepID=UPI00223551E2|nr:NAD(P)H-dependent oxidoreductase [Microbacterium sp. MPKO10]MCW4458475.1 NAD(P)H-dependent oxidoreductase [Microbacterium sp. MPKO10]